MKFCLFSKELWNFEGGLDAKRGVFGGNSRQNKRGNEGGIVVLAGANCRGEFVERKSRNGAGGSGGEAIPGE